MKIALPAMTSGWRARREGRFGSGTYSGSNAARGLRGATRFGSPRIASGLRRSCPLAGCYAQVKSKYGERVNRPHRTAYAAARRKTSDALVPPNPNEFDSTTSMSRLRALCGTRSIGVSTDGIVQIDGRRRHAVADRENREDRLDRAGRAEQVPDAGFGRGHRDLAGRIADHALDRRRARSSSAMVEVPCALM